MYTHITHIHITYTPHVLPVQGAVGRRQPHVLPVQGAVGQRQPHVLTLQGAVGQRQPHVLTLRGEVGQRQPHVRKHKVNSYQNYHHHFQGTIDLLGI